MRAYYLWLSLYRTALRHRALRRFLILALLTPGLSMASYGVISGEVESSVLFDAEAGRFEAHADLSLDWSFANGVMSAAATLSSDGWKKQTVRVEYEADRFEGCSTTTFEPYKNRFKEWKTTLAWELGNTEVELETRITRTTRWVTLDVERESDVADGAVSIRLRAPSGTGSFAFYDTEFTLDFRVCDVDVEAELTFDVSGFDELVVTLPALPINRLPGCEMQLEFVNTLAVRAIQLSFDIDKNADCFFEFDIRIDTPGTGILSGFTIDSVSIACERADVELEASAYFGPAHWKKNDVWLIVEAEKQIACTACGELRLSVEAEFAAGCGPCPRTVTQQLSYSPCNAVEFSLLIEQGDSGVLDTVCFSATLDW